VRFNNGRALVIGIANYDDASRLPDAVLDDAHDLASVLQSVDYCGFPATNVQLLIDEFATLDAIRSALADLASATDPEDTAIVFFSGHGARFGSGPDETSALVPVDCRIGDLEGTTLQESELSSAIAKIAAKRVLVFIDACHAGGAGVLKSGQGQQIQLGFSEKSLQLLAQGAGRVIIASSRATETSLVLNGARNSVFTGRLLEALRGKAYTAGDGLIRVFDVFEYVSKQVRGTVPGRQHPIFKATDLEDNFPVSLYRGGTKATSNTQLPAVDLWREFHDVMADLYPGGPADQDIWVRAGGDVARIKLSGIGRADWFAAMRTLRLGGGGQDISALALLDTAIGDFPHHPGLASLKSAI